ncbi:TetR/AcrR family transcriptional regulator [Paenibacillus sp. DMB20]|uniref:TetR/AcrR family transcriptional regulator n=1 Tax=Paenibacillus sp. DMB20 TaxID=1642570 RepID=UPI000627B5C9|nr:TetR/AcrR family transcriptional regulator [Paenibacillus sp. DMB20]KKO54732.1 TetR family transcriptional regulator [Paenibacillus sp. DMB20]
MSSQLILQAALAHFARDGYEGASLKNIADDCGIKKPSIYAHFASKEDLFLTALHAVFRRQEERIRGYFEEFKALPLEEQLKGFMLRRQQDYHRDDEVRFFLRVSFFPPNSLYNEVMDILYPFLDRQEDQLSDLLATGCPVEGSIIRNPRQAACAFLTLMDGIDVEILYGGEARSSRRLEQAWPVYWSGVTKERYHHETN